MITFPHGFLTTVGDAPSAFDNTYSVAFDGVNDYVDLGNVLDQDNDDAFSVSAWIKLSTISGWPAIVAKMNSTNPADNNGWNLSKNSSHKLYFGLKGSTEIYASSTSSLTAGIWYHVVGTYDGSGLNSGIEVYINGSLDTGTQSGTLSGNITNTINLNIGARANGNMLYLGNIDEVAIFNTELTAGNVTTIYNSGAPADLTSLSPTAWWRMGEGDTYPTLTDSGSGSNDGTMTNMSSGDIVEDVPTIAVQEGLIFNIDCLDTASYSGSGTTWASTVNSANNGTMGSDVAFSTPNMEFQGGADNNVSFPQSSNALTQASMTVEMWFYRQSGGSGNNMAIATRAPGGGTGIAVLVQYVGATNTYIKLYGLTSGFLLYMGNDFPEDVWQQFVITIDSSFTYGAKLYKNGAEISWTSPGTYIGVGGYSSATTDPILIGEDDNGDYDFDGYIDIVRLYDDALDDDEVLQNFDAEKGRFGL